MRRLLFLTAAMAGAFMLALPASHASAADVTPPVPAGVTERSIELIVDGERIPAKIDLPSGGAPRAAIVIVPGAFNSDVDGNYPGQEFYPHTYADLARGLAQRGFAALRYAKDGDGTGTIVFDPAAAKKHNAFAERVVVAAAAAHALRDAAPGAPLAVAGHSEGGLVATLLAAQDPSIRALVDLEAPGRPILDVLLEQMEGMIAYLQRVGMVTPQVAAAQRQAFASAVNAVRSGAPIPAEALGDRFVSLYFGKPTSVELAYLREEDAIDPAQAIVRVKQPTLIVQGTADEAVFLADARRLNRARAAADLPTTLKTIDGDQHFLKRVAAGTAPMEALRADGATDPAAVATIASWLSDQIRVSSSSHAAMTRSGSSSRKHAKSGHVSFRWDGGQG